MAAFPSVLGLVLAGLPGVFEHRGDDVTLPGPAAADAGRTVTTTNVSVASTATVDNAGRVSIPRGEQRLEVELPPYGLPPAPGKRSVPPWARRRGRR